MDTPSASLGVYEGNLLISCWTHSLVAGVKHLFNGGPWHMSHIKVTMMSSCTVPTHPIQVLVSFGTGSQSSRGLWGTGCRHQWRQRDRTCGRIVSDWHWGCVKCPSPYNGKSLILPWNPPRIRCAFCGVDSALPNASDLRNLRSLCFWGEDRFFVIHVRAKEFLCVKTWNWPKIDVKSWFAIPVSMVKFSFFVCEFVKNAIFNREIVILTLCFSWPLFTASTWKYMIPNLEIVKSAILWRENVKYTIYFPWIGYPYCPPSCFVRAYRRL